LNELPELTRVIPSERSESRNRSRPDREAFGQDDCDSSTTALRAFARNDGHRFVNLPSSAVGARLIQTVEGHRLSIPSTLLSFRAKRGIWTVAHYNHLG